MDEEKAIQTLALTPGLQHVFAEPSAGPRERLFLSSTKVQGSQNVLGDAQLECRNRIKICLQSGRG